MTWAASEAINAYTETGEVSLVDEETRTELEAAAEDEGVLVVRVSAPRPAARGRLALVVESAVEDALARRGAAPPGVGASSDLDASLSDQLYRARLVGSDALLISLGCLEGIANLAGALDAEDSAVLRWWVAATEERPVRMMFDARDRYLGVYAEPISLRRLIEPAPLDETPASSEYAAPAAAPEVRDSASAMELSDVPPAVEALQLEAPEPSRVQDKDAAALAKAMATLFDEHVESDDDRIMAEIDIGEILGEGASESAGESVSVGESVSESVGVSVGESESESESVCVGVSVGESESESESVCVSESVSVSEGESVSESVGAELVGEVELVTEPHASLGPLADPNEPTSKPETNWRSHVLDLESARGPKPLAVIERMFVSSYVPLCEAIARGEADEAAEATARTWAESFEKSYTEAFDALRMRGKRPTMVLDIPDIALRMARLHGARSVQLLLVDGMRFDLGLRINERVKKHVGQHAALTERLLMWSALPTTTEVQLELLGRGPQGLREMTGAAISEVPVARGRAAATLRRIRAGQRELHKLDIVESAMSVPGAPLLQRLDALADETAEALAGHLLKQSPRTLVLVFADHGFRLEPMGAGTSAAHRGGASPEEVLVPAHAWLVGAVH